MTSQGVWKDGLPYKKRYFAGIVCLIEGKAILDGKRRLKDGYNPAVVDTAGAVLGYKYFNFRTTKLNDFTLVLNAQASDKWSVKIELMPHNEKKQILLKEQELKPAAKGKTDFENYTLTIDKLTQKSELEALGGLMGSAALFVTVKPTASNVAIKEIGFS